MSTPACFKCGGETTFSQQIQPLAPTSGARIYTCLACGELTWSPISPPSPRVENTAGQQQQQIQPNKDEE